MARPIPPTCEGCNAELATARRASARRLRTPTPRAGSILELHQAGRHGEPGPRPARQGHGADQMAGADLRGELRGAGGQQPRRRGRRARGAVAARGVARCRPCSLRGHGRGRRRGGAESAFQNSARPSVASTRRWTSRPIVQAAQPGGAEARQVSSTSSRDRSATSRPMTSSRYSRG